MIARPALDAVTDALRDVVEPREAMEILATRGLLPDGDITIAWQVSRVFDFGDAPSPYTFVGGTRVVKTESVAVAGRGGSVRVELHVPPVEGAMDLEPRPPLPHHPWRGPVDTRDFQRSPMQVWFA